MKAIILILLTTSLALSAQEPLLQVVTKTIEDTYAYRAGDEVAVEGEKAEIFVETWNKPTISIRLEMTAKHPNLEVAQKELDNLDFVSEKAGQKYFLKNTRKDKSQRPESELIVHYYITLPEECPVYLKSHFGAATISNLRNRLRINGEYSQINIDNVEGLLDIRTRFGDIVGEKIEGNVVINSRRSDIELLDVGGSFTINAQYGELRFSPNSRLTDLQISAEKSDVYLFDPSGSPMQYTLTTTHGEMNIPNELPLVELENANDLRSVRIGSGQELAGEIKVSVSFGKLYLEKEKEKRLRQF